VVAGAILFCSLWSPAFSYAEKAGGEPVHTHSEKIRTDPTSIGFASVPELENRPRSDFENSVMGKLACTCGDCRLERINACRCEFAAKMRGEVSAQLDGLDLATETARGAAAEAVRASFVARYGSKVLGHDLDSKGYITGSLAAMPAFLVVVVLVRRWLVHRAGRQNEHLM
jgi:cytochrome c-type biogenesis protein CcmH/NrfF